MEKNELKELIRDVVKEEIKLAFSKMIVEQDNFRKKTPVKNKFKNIKKTTTNNKSKVVTNKNIREKINYSKNSIINDVLNETAATDEEWKSMGGGTYDSSNMNDILQSSYGKMMSDDSANSNGTLAAEMGVNPNDPSVDFLKKDYRKLMKAVDKKQGK